MCCFNVNIHLEIPVFDGGERSKMIALTYKNHLTKCRKPEEITEKEIKTNKRTYINSCYLEFNRSNGGLPRIRGNEQNCVLVLSASLSFALSERGLSRTDLTSTSVLHFNVITTKTTTIIISAAVQ